MPWYRSPSERLVRIWECVCFANQSFASATAGCPGCLLKLTIFHERRLFASRRQHLLSLTGRSALPGSSRILAFEWDEGKYGEVTFTLAGEGERTRLTLVHSVIADRAGAISFGGGWGSHLTVLKRRLRGDALPDFWALHAEAKARARAALGR